MMKLVIVGKAYFGSRFRKNFGYASVRSGDVYLWMMGLYAIFPSNTTDYVLKKMIDRSVVIKPQMTTSSSSRVQGPLNH